MIGKLAPLADRYRVDRELGAGGMATVFDAWDVRHDRPVAIKVLRPDLTAAVGAARFLQEIRIAARLSHPHILTLIDSGEVEGLLYFVMPRVQGETLRERLARDGRLPLDEAVRYLRDIVDALAFAHANRVVHRDVKPENVMLEGRHALVMDFGVAKALTEATDATQHTTEGVSLGTPAYMAPEQVAAEPNVDGRADLYSAGVLAYEMLAGRHPFAGLSPNRMMAAHVTTQPDHLATVEPTVPPWLANLVMRCLEKEPAARFQRAEDVLALLEPSVTAISGEAAARPRSPRRRIAWWATGLVAIGVATVLVVSQLTRHTAVTLGRSTALTGDPGLELFPRLSPDGRLIAYAAGSSFRMRLFIRPATGGRAIALTSDSVDIEAAPRWSPDGSTLLYATGGDLRTVAALGGASRIVVRAAPRAPIFAASWRPDGRAIAWTVGDSLFTAPAEGGPRAFVASRRELHSCDWSPSGRWIACVSGDVLYAEPGKGLGNFAASRIVLVASDGHDVHAVSDSTSMNQSPAWGASDAELFFVSDRDGPRDIYTQALTRAGRPRGAPTRVTVGSNVHSVHLSVDGTRMVYSVYGNRANLWSVRLPSHGSVSIASASQLTTGNQTVESMTVSRDERWVLYDSDLSGNADVYRMPAGGGAAERLTSSPEGEFRPELSPDSRSVAYHSFHAGSRDIFVLPLDGGKAAQITSSDQNEARPSWSPDGRSLAFVNITVYPQPFVIHRTPTGGWTAPVPRDTAGTIQGGSCFASPEWSSEGRLLAYCAAGAIRIVPADSGDAMNIYSPDTLASRPIAEWVMWSRTGRTLFFRGLARGGAGGIWSIDAGGGSLRQVLRFDDPSRPVPRAEFAVSSTHLYFTVSDRQSDIWISEVARR